MEVINDGIHVQPAVIRMLYRLAPGRVALVSDAMAAAGGGDGRYHLGNLDVEVAGGVARVIEGLRLLVPHSPWTLRSDYGVQTVGLTPLEVIEAATVIPARILGVDDEFGHLEPGYVGDAVLFDKDLAGTECLDRRAVGRGAGAVGDGSCHQYDPRRGRKVGCRRDR